MKNNGFRTTPILTIFCPKDFKFFQISDCYVSLLPTSESEWFCFYSTIVSWLYVCGSGVGKLIICCCSWIPGVREVISVPHVQLLQDSSLYAQCMIGRNYNFVPWEKREWLSLSDCRVPLSFSCYWTAMPVTLILHLSQPCLLSTQREVW